VVQAQGPPAGLMKLDPIRWGGDEGLQWVELSRWLGVDSGPWSRRTSNGCTGWIPAVPDFPAYDARGLKAVI
jgi:hypothetical protein